MSYHVIDPEELAATPDRPCDRRPVGEAAGLENFALNVYTAQPGEEVPLAYHYHDEQEEAFVVLDGTLTVETPELDYAVEAGETFVAEPGSPHRAHVPADAPSAARVVAVGAPAVDDAHPYEDA
ncbi:cupin domain-containing protein [Halarchaeum grantii]|uniref:cupin domain-containing protein n=1 Tax=Halarchaeum grantii TaxID=1193105 RepID=UPI00166AAE44|nr:cupin domain-containing protein [Halarchaeum grantii]